MKIILRILTPLLMVLVFPLYSLTLEQSIELAKQNNKALLAAKEDVIIADQSYYEVRGLLLPQLNLQGAYQLSKTWMPESTQLDKVDFSTYLDDNATSNDSILAGICSKLTNSMIPDKTVKEGSIAGQLKLDQIIFSGGKLTNGLHAIGRYRSIQKLRYKLKEQDLIAATTDMFYQTLLAQKVKEIQHEALDIAIRHLNQVELLNQEGQVSEFDLLRARLEVAKLRPNVVQAQNNYDLALSAFKKQIGYADSVIILEGEFLLPQTCEETLQEALSLAEKQRIELQLSSINTEIMKINYQAEKGNYLPNIALTAGYSLFTAADEYAIERDDFGTAFNVGIGFSIPLFTGLANTAKRNHAKHTYTQARINETDTQEMIALQVKQAWQQLQSALENYNVQVENTKLAERSLQLAQVRYESQVGIQLEVFDAQISLNSVKLAYYNSIYNVISSNQQLKKAMGYNL